MNQWKTWWRSTEFVGEFVNSGRLVGSVAKAARSISGGVGAGSNAADCQVCAAARATNSATNSAATTLISRQQRMVELEQQVAKLAQWSMFSREEEDTYMHVIRFKVGTKKYCLTTMIFPHCEISEV